MAALNPVLTVGRQVGEVLRRHTGSSGSAERRRVIELLATVGIPDPDRRFDQYPHEMSGGMAQRVVIAMAIACGPALLLADEPTTALDVTIQASILRTLDKLRRDLDMAVILITHDLGVVADVADRVLVMYAGRVVEEGAVQAIFSDPKHHYTRGLLAAVRDPSTIRPRTVLSEIPGVVPDDVGTRERVLVRAALRLMPTTPAGHSCRCSARSGRAMRRPASTRGRVRSRHDRGAWTCRRTRAGRRRTRDALRRPRWGVGQRRGRARGRRRVPLASRG